MKLNQIKRLNLTIILLLFGSFLSGTAQAKPPVSTMVEGDFRDVRNNVEDAIRSKGLNIANVLHASDMLNRTGSDFGVVANMYERAEIIEFCSTKISHAISQANHQNILMCPFKIAVYNLSAEPESIYILYASPIAKDEKSKEAVSMVEELLQSIVEEATSW